MVIERYFTKELLYGVDTLHHVLKKNDATQFESMYERIHELSKYHNTFTDENIDTLIDEVAFLTFKGYKHGDIIEKRIPNQPTFDIYINKPPDQNSYQQSSYQRYDIDAPEHDVITIANDVMESIYGDRIGGGHVFFSANQPISIHNRTAIRSIIRKVINQSDHVVVNFPDRIIEDQLLKNQYSEIRIPIDVSMCYSVTAHMFNFWAYYHAIVTLYLYGLGYAMSRPGRGMAITLIGIDKLLTHMMIRDMQAKRSICAALCAAATCITMYYSTMINRNQHVAPTAHYNNLIKQIFKYRNALVTICTTKTHRANTMSVNGNEEIRRLTSVEYVDRIISPSTYKMLMRMWDEIAISAIMDDCGPLNSCLTRIDDDMCDIADNYYEQIKLAAAVAPHLSFAPSPKVISDHGLQINPPHIIRLVWENKLPSVTFINE